MSSRYSDRILYLNPFSFGMVIIEGLLVLWCAFWFIASIVNRDIPSVPLFFALGAWNAYSISGSLKLRRKDLNNYYLGLQRRRVKWY